MKSDPRPDDSGSRTAPADIAALASREPPSARSVLAETRAALVVTLLLALLAGAVFPALVLGIGAIAFPAQTSCSLLRGPDGQVVGSHLVGQSFVSDRFFHGRPSAAGTDGYDAAASTGLNLAPTSPELAATVVERARAFRALNGVPADTPLPADAVTTSASGLDPHISPANAALQVARIARARGLSESAVRELLRGHVERPLLGVLGEPRVNVLELNLALEEMPK